MALMLCPACQADAPDGAAACPKCQAALPPLKRKRRRRGEPDDDLDPARVAGYDAQVSGLMPYTAAAAVPVAGLVLAPLGALLAWRLLRRGRGDPAFTARRGARLQLRFALFCAALQWLGLSLVVLAW